MTERKRTESSGKNSREFMWVSRECGTARPRRGSSAAVVGFLGMSEHALTVLDFYRVLELVAERATSEAGRAAVRLLRPQTDRNWVERELTRVSETGAFLETRSPWAPSEIPDCLPIFGRLAVEEVRRGTPLAPTLSTEIIRLAVPGLSTDVRFVHFDNSPELALWLVSHRKPDAMHQE